MIRIPATLTRAQLWALREHEGQVNSSPLSIANTRYPARSVRFRGVTSAMPQGGHVYDGWMQFEPVDAVEHGETATFEALEGFPEAAAPTESVADESRVIDVVPDDD